MTRVLWDTDQEPCARLVRLSSRVAVVVGCGRALATDLSNKRSKSGEVGGNRCPDRPGALPVNRLHQSALSSAPSLEVRDRSPLSDELLQCRR
jgi:hypothetical protein